MACRANAGGWIGCVALHVRWPAVSPTIGRTVTVMVPPRARASSTLTSPEGAVRERSGLRSSMTRLPPASLAKCCAAWIGGRNTARPRRSSTTTSERSCAATMSGARAASTRPEQSPCGSTSTLGANRSPPTWEHSPADLSVPPGDMSACHVFGPATVAAASARGYGRDQLWECSHVGGDRFAPNVLVLPHGLYYGRVEAARAPDIVAAQERSEVVVELLRGRAVFRPPIQAAQHFARLAGGNRVIDDLNPLRSRTAPSGDVTVELARARGGTITVTVRPIVGETAGHLTCKATHPIHPPAFALHAIDSHDSHVLRRG